MQYDDLPEPLKDLVYLRMKEQGKLERLNNSRSISWLFSWNGVPSEIPMWSRINGRNILPCDITYAETVLGKKPDYEIQIYF